MTEHCPGAPWIMGPDGQNHPGPHCWHKKPEYSIKICCHCGQSKVDMHGPYRPHP